MEANGKGIDENESIKKRELKWLYLQKNGRTELELYFGRCPPWVSEFSRSSP